MLCFSDEFIFIVTLTSGRSMTRTRNVPLPDCRANVLNSNMYYCTLSSYEGASACGFWVLAIPTTRGVTYCNICFRKAAATLWNNLPVTIRKCKTLDTFKKKIKTNIFISAFPSWIYYVFGWKEFYIFKRWIIYYQAP